MNQQPDFSRLMQGVIPYLCVDGAEKAVDFYTKAFGAIQHGPAVKDDRGVVMNVSIEINGGMVMLMDLMPEIGTPEGMAATSQGMTMQLVTRDGDMWWNRAVAAGCEVTQPFKLEFWGDRYGRLRDPFGLAWAINEPGGGQMNDQMTGQSVVDAATWQAARAALLIEEKRLTREADRVAALRRQMPWQWVEKPYRFVTPDGDKSLADLFEGRRQLIVYHHMLRKSDPAPCPGCGMLADDTPNVLAHLHARNTTHVMVSHAPLAEILAFRARMGWTFPWVETTDSFNPDFGVGQHGPGYTVFIQQGGNVYHTYGCTDRGTEAAVGTFGLLDITPMGRQEVWQEAPAWVPQDEPYLWWRLHDQYGA